MDTPDPPSPPGGRGGGEINYLLINYLINFTNSSSKMKNRYIISCLLLSFIDGPSGVTPLIPPSRGKDLTPPGEVEPRSVWGPYGGHRVSFI